MLFMFFVFSISKKHVLNTCDALSILELGNISIVDKMWSH